MYLNPKNIIVDFLRNRLTDPRSRAETAESDSFTATSSQTIFTLSPTSGSVSCITGVTVNAADVVKWQDYYIDFQNEKIIFFSGLTISDAVVVNYKSGATNWIYPDKPNTKLSALSFPRINILIVAGTGNRLGQYEADVESSIHFQIDIWSKEKASNQIFTIDSKKYTGETLVDYLAFKITEAFEEHEADLHPVLYSYTPLQMPRDLPYDEELQCHHKVVEFMLKGLELGRIS